MLHATRKLTYKMDYTSKFGETVTLESVYDIRFRRYPDSKFTYITIKPDIGPQKQMKVQDCGITWKSLLKASEFCAKDAGLHIGTWFAMDVELNCGDLLGACSWTDVIPEQELSTGRHDG